MNNRLYRIGLIGLGQIASEIDEDPVRNIIWSHAKAYLNQNKTTICAVCDIDKTKIDRFLNKRQIQLVSWNIGR